MSAENQPAESPRTRPINILVVDDEEPLLAFMETVLADAGYTVHTAVNPRQALAWLDSVNWKVDLIVSDVLMPEVDGLTFLRQVHQRSEGIALLIISGFIGAEDLWGEHSRVPFLAKPFNHEDLLNSVTACLAHIRGTKPQF